MMFGNFSSAIDFDPTNHSRSGASLTEQVTDLIRHMIMDGELPLGGSISEMALAEKFKISKSPVRSALKSLAQEGLVHIYPQRGTFVFAPSKEEWVSMSEFRRYLELQCFELAYARNREALSQAVATVIRDMTTAYEKQDAKSYIHQDILFHLAIVNSTQNRFFSKAYNLVVAKVAKVLLYLGVDRRQIDRSYKEHVEISSLLNNGAYDEAHALFQKHLQHAQIYYGSMQEQQEDALNGKHDSYPS